MGQPITDLLQAEWLVHAAMIVGFLLAVALVAHLLLHPRSPSGTLAWLLAIVLVPFVGVPLYLLIGGRKTQRTAARKAKLDFAAVPDASTVSPVDGLLVTYGLPPAATGHRVKLCLTGEDIYSDLIELIEGAQKSVYISTYIFRKDALGKAILEKLTQKASQGLDVRLLLDGVGSMYTGKRFLRPLIAAGGKTAHFIPFLHNPFRARTNLRNHRKIVIADGAKVLAGGTNIGLEYIGPSPQPDRWCDLSFVLEGPTAAVYNDIFISDWQFASGDMSPAVDPASLTIEGGTTVQVVPSGPDVPDDPFYDAVVTAIFAAKKRLWIVTPYFVPDATLAQAMAIAARRGVDVRIVVPDHSNHVLADLVRNEHLRSIGRSGGMVMRYKPRMLHAKLLIADDDLAIIGSANIDLRSLLLNYEVAMLMYSRANIEVAEEWTRELMKDCDLGVRDASFVRRLFEGVLRTLAPLV